ncbi:unnamed protein product [Pleuronectes platessa]|uniref:Uncharacterized protein n=1 Tax=Pleuronectes platessa TaxID=8262 RepID=A0A9N7VVU7_PLEPL|nr:unnamed protein product [Pleuronectes platessa]
MEKGECFKNDEEGELGGGRRRKGGGLILNKVELPWVPGRTKMRARECRQEGGKDIDRAEKGGREMVKIYLSRRRRRRRSGGDGGGDGGGGASEFLIIATATSHLATGYTMAAVALATAWSLAATRGG